MSFAPSRVLALVVVFVAACALRPPDDFQASAGEDPGTTVAETWATSTAALTTGGPETAGVTMASEPTTGALSSTGGVDTTAGTSGADTTSSFIGPYDFGPSKGCDVWTDDCPEGQKCMPFANDGGNAWNDLKCVPVVPDPDGFGEPCHAIESGVSGLDTCDRHMFCWDLDLDTLAGTCVPMCVGSPDAPACEQPDTSCVFGADSVLNLCLAHCDPVLQDCPDDDLCIPNPVAPDVFLCVLDASGEEGQVFDPCEYSNACDPGLSCVTPTLAGECDPQAFGCCLPFCDLEAPGCPGQGLECLPWHEEGQAPAGYEHVGLCMLPMP